MTQALAREYHHQRAHQAATYGSLTTYPSGRTEYSAGSAPYGEHALSAYMAAKRMLYFRKSLSETVAAGRKRSRAAKRGWKTRKG